jgi:hypothetical protein
MNATADLNIPVFTWLPMAHLPKVPEFFVDRARLLAGSVDLEQHADVLHTRMKNQHEYKSRKLKIAGRDLSSRYQISLPMGPDWADWVAKNLVSTVIETSARLSLGESSVHGAHCDLGRKWKLYYLIDRGGDDVQTVFYRQHGHPIVRNEIKDHDDRSVVCNDYHALEEIDRAQWPLCSWVLINTMILHGVINVKGTRLNLTVSVDPWFDQLLLRPS